MHRGRHQHEDVTKLERKNVQKQAKICMDDDNKITPNAAILPYCEVKIKYEDDNESIADEDEELVHLNDEIDDDDVYGDFSCHKCKISFNTWNMLKRHTKSAHEAIECFKCKICLKVYNKSAAFSSHVVADHGTGSENTSEFLEKLTLYRVSRGTSFYTRVQRAQSAQQEHKTMENVEIKELLSCSQCDYKIKSKRQLASHIAKHVNNIKFSCETCGQKFKLRRKLTYHIRFSHRDQNCICDVCGKTFRTNKLLHGHRRFVHFEGKYECKICNRLLISQENLDIHMMRVHIEKKPRKKAKPPPENVVCDACGKVFTRHDKLRMHMRVHTGEKPYVCPVPVCRESFAKQNSLRQHLLLHTGRKPYVCDICGKAFAQKPGLSGHRRSHPGPHPPLPPVFIGNLLDDVLRQCEQ